MVFILAVFLQTAKAQTKIERLDSNDFKTRFDSLIQRINKISTKSNHKYELIYYQIIKARTPEVEERFGIIGVDEDTVTETFAMRPYVRAYGDGSRVWIDSLIVNNILLNDRLLPNPKLKTWLQLFDDNNDHLLIPTVVNGRVYYPTKSFSLIILSKGGKYLIGFARYGLDKIDANGFPFKNGQEFLDLSNWVFNYHKLVNGEYPRMKGTMKINWK